MVSFSFNGESSDDYKIIVLEVYRPLFSGANDNYVQIPGRHGSRLFPGKLKDKLVRLDCALVTDTEAEFLQEVRKIAAWLYAEDKKVLSISDEEGKSYLAKLSEDSDLENSINFPDVGKFVLIFNCDPFVYGEAVTKDFAVDAVVVNNAGAFPAPVVVDAIFTGAASEWKVSLGTKYVRVVNNFVATDTLQINTETGAVLINGARAMNKLDWQNSDFFEIASGDNNLSILPAGVCTAKIKHVPRWS